MLNTLVWKKIVEYGKTHENKFLKLLTERGQSFVATPEKDAILITFANTGRHLKLAKKRFILAHDCLEKHKGNWVEIGSSRIGTEEESLEGYIKKGMGDEPSGLSTAPWIAALLLYAMDDVIEYNYGSKTPEIRLIP